MTVVTASLNQWFVETDFGALLGPMPADALVEMARTGALLPRDRVREGTDGSWRFANDVSGLFDVDERSLQSPITAPRQAPLRAPRKPESPIDVVASSADPLKELLESWPKERENPPIQSEAGSAPEELDVDLDRPLVESTAAGKSSSWPRSLVSIEREPQQTRGPAPPPEPVTATEPMPPLEPPWRSPSSARLTDRRFPTHFQPRRWKQRLLILMVSVAVFSVFATTWWTWPRKRPDIYAQYVAVYKELQQRRENTADQAGWNEFVARARTKIEENLPWLESHAKPGARETSLLLYVGRDLHEMLGQPRESEYPHQQRMDGILNQLQTIYTPSKSDE